MSAERWRERVRRARQEVDAAREWRGQVDDDAAEMRARYAREDLLRALANKDPIPDSVREARRRFEEDLEDNDEAIRAGDPEASARHQDLMRQATDAECAAGIHRFCSCRGKAEQRQAEQREQDLRRDVEALRRLRFGPPPDEEDPVTGDWFDARRAQVWGVIQPDGSVVAKGFVGDETADEDQAVYPAGSLAYYSPEFGWTNAATGHPASRGPARPEVETLMPDQPDVKVHHSKGCGLCGRTDPHTHTLSDWRAHIGGDVGGGYEPPPAAQPFEPSKYEAEAQRQADHRRRHNEWVDAENEKSAAHRREQDVEAARRARLAADLARHDAAVEARKRPDLADLRRGRWYDEKPITSTNTGSGGSGMSINEVQAGIAASNEKANEGLGAVQQAHAALEEAQGLLMHATEGSGQADVSDSLGMLAQSIAAIEEARQMLPAAISASEGVANRL